MKAKAIFEKNLNITLVPEYKYLVGNPKKNHSFDLVSVDETVFIECKYRSWSVGEIKKVSSGSRKSINEDILHLMLLDKDKRKIICLNKTEELNNLGLTYAQEYFRHYSYLFGEEIELYEITEDSMNRIISD